MTDIEAGLLRGFRPAPSRAGEQMTEDPLFAAIRAYELHIRHCQLLRQEPSDEARDALIAAFDADARRRAFVESDPSYRLLLAKADVCDAYTAYWLADKEVPAGPLRDAMDALTAACAALRDLESKNK